MNIFDRITSIASGIILTIISLFLPASQVNISQTAQQTVTPTTTPTVIEAPTINFSPTITPKIARSVTVSPSATPTPTQETINRCNQLPHPKQYFDGIKCYPDEYQQYLKDKKIDGGNTSELIFRELLYIKNADTKELLESNCLKIGPVAYEHCNGSLVVNVDRLKSQILDKYTSELKGCLSNIAEGDNKNRDLTKDLYWRIKMKEKMDELYLWCNQHNDNLDKYNF